MSVERVIDSAERLGECPLWDERSQALWWVDILAPAIKRFDGKLQVFPMPEPVGSIALRAKGGLLAAMQTGIYVWEKDRLTLLAKPSSHDQTHRFNDGRCDGAGRFWVGTMKDPEHTPTGSLYRLEKDGSSKRMKTIAAVSAARGSTRFTSRPPKAAASTLLTVRLQDLPKRVSAASLRRSGRRCRCLMIRRAR